MRLLLIVLVLSSSIAYSQTNVATFSYLQIKHCSKINGQTTITKVDKSGGTITLGKYFVKVTSTSPQKVNQSNYSVSTFNKIEDGHYIAFDDNGVMYSFISKGNILLINNDGKVLMYNLSLEASAKMDAYMSSLYQSVPK